MKVIAITQARYGSSRLPGKILREIKGQSILFTHLQRAGKSKKVDKFIVATTLEPEASEIAKVATSLNWGIYQGSQSDVLDRYYQAAKLENPDYVVRITSDCPLIDPAIMDDVIDACIKGNFDYCSNTLDPTFPDGMDVEVFTFAALEKAWNEAILQADREHVTPYISRNSSQNGGKIFSSKNYTGKKISLSYD